MARTALPVAREDFSPLTALSTWSEEQLLILLAARPDLANPAPRDLPALAARASTWTSIHQCTFNLNEASQQIVEALCLLPQPTTAVALAALLGIDPTSDALATNLDHLADVALVLRLGDRLRVHPQLDDVQYPARLGPPAHVLLSSIQVPLLREIAAHLGVIAGASRHDLLSALSEGLADPERVTRAVRAGPTGTVDLVNRLAGQYPTAAVPGGTSYVRANSPMAWLIKCGLVVSIDWDTVVMPREVGLALRGGRPFPNCTLRPPPLRWHPIDAAETDRAGRQQALDVVADVAAILEGWQEAPPKLLKAGGIGIRDVRRAAAGLGRSETQASRLIELAAMSGLAGWDAGTDRALPRPAYDDWLALDGGRRWGVLAAGWLTAEVHLNLAGAIGTNQKPIPPLLNRWPEVPARQRRRLVLAALHEGEAGHAPNGDDLAARVIWDAPAVWLGGPAMPPLLISWVREEAAMLGLVASGGLSNLGRLVLAGRIDDAVAELTAHAAPLTAQFVVQGDLTAVATGQLPGPVRSELELLATVESSGAATVFRFSEASLRRAFDRGRTASQIIEFLDVHAIKGVPQPLSYLIEDIGRRHGRVRIGPAACYLRSDDPALLTEVASARRLAKLGLRQLAPTVLVSEAAPEVVIDTLRATGYLPAMEDSTGTLVLARRPVLRATTGPAPTADKGGPIGADGLARLLADPPSLAVYSQSVISGRSGPEQRDLEGLARRLRKPTTTGAAIASGRAAQPNPSRPAQDRSGSAGPAPVAPPISQLRLLDSGPSRPAAIARTAREIDDLLELAFENDWLLRLEYAGQKGRVQQINAVVFSLDGRHVDVGTVPGHGSRTLAVARIRWARVMTVAEEEALGV